MERCRDVSTLKFVTVTSEGKEKPNKTKEDMAFFEELGGVLLVTCLLLGGMFTCGHFETESMV